MTSTKYQANIVPKNLLKILMYLINLIIITFWLYAPAHGCIQPIILKLRIKPRLLLE